MRVTNEVTKLVATVPTVLYGTVLYCTYGTVLPFTKITATPAVHHVSHVSRVMSVTVPVLYPLSLGYCTV